MDRFLERALAREPDLRFQSADELDAAFALLVDPCHDGAASGPKPRAPAEPSPRAVAGVTVPEPPELPLLASTGNTLSATGQVLAVQPGHGGRAGLLLALVAMFVAVGLAAFFLLAPPPRVSTPHPAGDALVDDGGQPPGHAPVVFDGDSARRSAELRPQTPADAAPPPAAVTAPPIPTASAIKPPSKPPPARPAPPSAPPRKPASNDDPLREM